jgi:hypothetical protein
MCVAFHCLSPCVPPPRAQRNHPLCRQEAFRCMYPPIGSCKHTVLLLTKPTKTEPLRPALGSTRDMDRRTRRRRNHRAPWEHLCKIRPEVRHLVQLVDGIVQRLLSSGGSVVPFLMAFVMEVSWCPDTPVFCNSSCCTSFDPALGVGIGR